MSGVTIIAVPAKDSDRRNKTPSSLVERTHLSRAQEAKRAPGDDQALAAPAVLAQAAPLAVRVVSRAALAEDQQAAATVEVVPPTSVAKCAYC